MGIRVVSKVEEFFAMSRKLYKNYKDPWNDRDSIFCPNLATGLSNSHMQVPLHAKLLHYNFGGHVTPWFMFIHERSPHDKVPNLPLG